MAPSFDINPSKATVRKTVAKKVSTQKAPERFEPVRSAPRPAYVRPVHRQTAAREQVRRAGVLPLKARRRAARKRLFLTGCIGLLVLAGIAIIILWQSPLRVTEVSAKGIHEHDIPDFVRSQLQGTVYGVIPKNSIFFLPREELRTGILAAYPDIEAVSLSPTGLTGLNVTSIARARSFWWCGTEYIPKPSKCYDTDATGRIFKEVTLAVENASSTATSTVEVSAPESPPFVMYGAYQGGSEISPVGGTLNGSSYLPDLLRFIKSIKELGANVTSARIREDEADLYTASGTRITYVLGHEHEALTLAATSFPSLDVSGTSLLYIDLRFSSKIYYKKKSSQE